MTSQLLPPAPPAEPPTGRLSAAFASRFGGLSRPFWIIFSGTVVNRIGDMVVPFLVFFLGSRGIPTEATGSIVVALGAGGLAGPALGGWLADRVGRRFVLITGLVATPFSLGVLFAAPSLSVLAVAAALLGLSGKVYPPAANALVGDWVAPAVRARAFSLLHWAVNIGTAVAGATAGFLAARGYWLLFVLDAATCLTYAVVVARGIPKDPPRPRRQVRTGDSGYRVVLADRLMVRFTLLTVLATIVYNMTEFAIPLAIRLDGLPPTVFGLAAVVNAVLIVALQPMLYGWLVRFDRVKVLAASWSVVAVGVASTGLAHEPWQYALTVVVWSLGEVGSGIVAGGIVGDLAPAEAPGRYQGAISWGWAVARLVGPASSTTLVAVAGPGALWWGCLAVGVLGAVALLRLGPAINTRTAVRR